MADEYGGGAKSLTATVIPTLVCPSDSFAGSPVGVVSAPGANPNFPEGYYCGLSSYGVNAGTEGYSPSPTPPLKDGVFHVNSRVRLDDITDGTSTTLLTGEGYHADPLWGAICAPGFDTFPRWYYHPVGTGPAAPGPYALFRWGNAPVNYRFGADVAGLPQPGQPGYPGAAVLAALARRAGGYGSGHPGGANVCFGDGSVRFLRDGTALAVLQALSTRAKGEALGGDW